MSTTCRKTIKSKSISSNQKLNITDLQETNINETISK